MKIYICGDSTAASYTEERAPLTGWGMKLGDYLPGVEVVNKAMAGRSTKSYLYEGRLTEIEKTLAAGDLLLIQFGHNDTSDLVWRHTDAYTSYINNLSIFIDTARMVGAIPVLLTPICVRSFREDGTLRPSHGVYPDAIRTLAGSKNVPLIDMYQLTFDNIAKLGDEASRKLHMHLEPGVYPAYPDGQKDDTHTQVLGAQTNAKFVAEGLRKLGLIKEGEEA